MSELKNNSSISKSELALQYDITARTLRSWLHRAGFYQEFPQAVTTQILTPKELSFIHEKLGNPNE